MARGLLIIVLLGLLGVAENAVRPPRARCAFCFTGRCYNSAMCFRGCACLKHGMDFYGECVSVGELGR